MGMHVTFARLAEVLRTNMASRKKLGGHLSIERVVKVVSLRTLYLDPYFHILMIWQINWLAITYFFAENAKRSTSLNQILMLTFPLVTLGFGLPIKPTKCK